MNENKILHFKTVGHSLEIHNQKEEKPKINKVSPP